jgi:hypothetical protein
LVGLNRFTVPLAIICSDEDWPIAILPCPKKKAGRSLLLRILRDETEHWPSIAIRFSTAFLVQTGSVNPQTWGICAQVPKCVFWCHLQRSEHQPMSNIRDERRALRDQQRAAIKAAVAHANAITQPVVSFPARTKVAEHRSCDVARIPARSDGC